MTRYDESECASLAEDGIQEGYPNRHFESNGMEYTTSKYYSRAKSQLHEAIMLDGHPIFATYNQATCAFEFVPRVLEPDRVLLPPTRDECLYDPYEFASIAEIERYRARLVNEDPGSLFKIALDITRKYVDQQGTGMVKLVAADIVWSYFQDRFPTTHYLWIIGDNGTGKTSIGEVFVAIGYRPVGMTDATAPNYLRSLGTIEPGQCTLVIHEIDDSIGRDPGFRRLLKTGYQAGGRVPRINRRTNKPQSYHAYCLKILIGEGLPRNNQQLKGVIDRSFVFSCTPGRPEHDIKEVRNPAGNQVRQQLLNELQDFRKLMLAYRLIHFNDPVVELDIGVEGRDKELCKPLIQLFHNTSAQDEVENVLQNFIDEKNRMAADDTVEQILLRVVTKLMTEQKTTALYLRDVWSEMKTHIQSFGDAAKPHKIETDTGGIIYRTDASRIALDKFGATKKLRNDGTILIFDAIRLKRLQDQYKGRQRWKISVKEAHGQGVVKTVNQVKPNLLKVN